MKLQIINRVHARITIYKQHEKLAGQNTNQRYCPFSQCLYHGTVDRVLHNRGEVSAKSREKVEKVLRERNNQPNIYASALASKKRYTFVTLLPESNEGEYWSDIKKGVDQAAHEFLDLNISVEQIFFNQYDSTSFEKAIETVLKLAPDAVLLAPIFKEQSISLAKQLEIQEIPYVLIDSDMEEIHSLAYFSEWILYKAVILLPNYY